MPILADTGIELSGEPELVEVHNIIKRWGERRDPRGRSNGSPLTETARGERGQRYVTDVAAPTLGGRAGHRSSEARFAIGKDPISTCEEASVTLVDDLHHMTFLTADLDRLIAFCERIFDARVTLDREDDGHRHAFIEIGPHTVLHPFQVPGVAVPGRQRIFERGRLDHFALNAASEEAFREIRRRLIAEGANATEGGLVTDMGSRLSFSFHDPDSAWHEVIWVKSGVPMRESLKRPSEWTMIELD